MSESLKMRAEIGVLEARLRDLKREVPAQERDRMRDAAARHDAAASMIGKRARDPMPGESESDYRCALLREIQPHTQSWKQSNFARLDSATLDVLEPRVHAEVRRDAIDNSRQGTLVPYVETDISGRKITKFAGDIGAFMAPFMATGQVGFINRNPKGGQ